MGNFVIPKVYKIAETKLCEDGVQAWLKDIDGVECLAHVAGEDKEKLIEFCGRRCYKSYKPGLNPNVSRIRTNSTEYHRNVLDSKHGSILEHANVTFAIENVSRAITHELVRHRAGVAVSQESLRYVRLNNINMYYPVAFSKTSEDKEKKVREIVIEAQKYLEDVQIRLADLFKDEMAKDFDTKKKLTSSFRRLAPIGLATGIILTFNFRALRHVIAMRTSRHAEEEIRNVVGQMAEIAMADYPMVFGDFQKVDTGDGLFEYVPKYEKV